MRVVVLGAGAVGAYYGGQLARAGHEAGGPTELDILSGAVSRFAEQAGIATPVHDTATAALATPRRAPAP